MSIQYTFAANNKEYKPTYIGKLYHITDKFHSDPRFKHKVPKRWLSNGWVVEVDKK